MSQTIDVLRSELERLFSLEEMTSVASLVGFSAEEVGAHTAKASFARALAERCIDRDAVEALVDVILQMRREVDPKLRDVGSLLGEPELAAGKVFGPYTIDKKLSATEMGVVYFAKKNGVAFMLKTLRREAARDHRAVQRFLTQNRLVATVQHEGLPKNIDAGEIEGTFYVAYEHIDAQPLATRFARTGPSHINELRPILRATLEPLAALHKAHLTHGDLKMDHALVMRGADAQSVKVVLIDFGGDRLRPRLTPTSGQYGLLAVYGSPKTISPEQVRGKSADARTDVYAFGAMLYELLSGKPVFAADNGAADAAMAHLSKAPDAPSVKAPRGWVTKEVDAFVLSLLAKDPAQRPKDAGVLLEVIDSLGKPAAQKTPAQLMPEEKLHELVDALVAMPEDPEAAIALEKAVDQVAEPAKIAEAFAIAADQLELKTDDDKETKKSLLYRAARIFDGQKDKAHAEDMYQQICELDPEDDVASGALETVRKSLGKFDEIVEMLLARADRAKSSEDRARIMAEIGRTYATELNDMDQALVAYTQALTERPTVAEVAVEVERLAAGKTERWNDVLASITEAVKAELPQGDKNALLALAGRWYDTKLGRVDTALHAFQQILVTEPASEVALEGLSHIYRKAQQWPELATTLLSHADAMGSSPRARDLRSDAAELFESRLNDAKKARELYQNILQEDPAHARAGDALAKIAEKDGDYKTLVTLLDRRVEARRDPERAEVLARIAEVYEDNLNDLPEATRRYEAVLAIDPNHLVALKGLDRIFNRTGRYRELLENLERQIAVAATPRQKINLYERMAGLYDEEFVDHTKASECLEGILALDPSNDGALTALARHYRAEGKWEEVIKIYERHAAATHDEARRVELMLARARTLAEQVGSPDRATRAFEQVLETVPDHAGALEALARLRETSGDANAALTAIEALAAKEQAPEKKADQWMRAAKLLESRGDRDGAISRYKLALEANPKDTSASAALRAAYASRGDAVSVVELIEKELSFAESNLAKARLHAELARLQRYQLRDDAKAEVSAKLAYELDSNNPDAQLILGDTAYDGQRFIEAAKYYETLVGRTASLPKEDSTRVLLRYVEASGKVTSSPTLPPTSASSPDLTPFTATTAARSAVNPRLLVAVETLEKLSPDDAETAARAAKVILDFGDASTARKMYVTLFEKFGSKIVGQERAEALYGLGEASRRSGDLDGAIKPLREAAEADPSSPRPLRALARVYEAKDDFKEAVRIRRRRLEMAVGQERFELLLEIGDFESQKLNDRTAAGKTYATALEERPDDRKLLTRLMQLYSEEKDWRKLVEVVLRLADFVDDQKQRAKYMQTAAIVSARQIGDVDAALTYYDRAIEFDPTLSKAVDEALELAKQKGDHDGVEKYLNVQLEQAKQAQDRVAIPRILDQLGALYQKFLNEPEMAIDAFEAAQAFDPDNKDRGDTLAELYASDAPQYLEKAVKAQAVILRRNPYRVESYKLLRKLYTEAQRGDAAWCLCQALAVLNLAEPDEERFWRRHRADNAAPAQAVMTEEDWRKLAHFDQDPILTNIFAMIQPTIIRTRTQPLEALGYDRRYAIDPSLHPYPVSQTLYYVQGVLGMQGANSPLVFQNQNDPSGLGFVHAHTPAIVLGRAAFESQVPTQSMAFVAGRHLTYYRSGYYVRHLVPTGTGLKAWLFAAIKTCVPQFPVSADLVGPVDEAMAAMKPDFMGVQKELLSSLVSKLIQTGASLDLKKWTASIDLTADRIGFLLAHDLQLATEVIRATEEGASVPGKERVKEVVLFSVSEEYFEIRQKLSIAIE